MCTAEDGARTPHEQAYNALKDPYYYRVWIFDSATKQFKSCEINEYSEKPVEENTSDWEVPELNHGPKRIELDMDRWRVLSMLISFPEVIKVERDIEADSLDSTKFIEVTHGDWLDNIYYHDL